MIPEGLAEMTAEELQAMYMGMYGGISKNQPKINSSKCASCGGNINKFNWYIVYAGKGYHSKGTCLEKVKVK